jgi:hypothetical protein
MWLNVWENSGRTMHSNNKIKYILILFYQKSIESIH